jgi:hypothetical protein
MNVPIDALQGSNGVSLEIKQQEDGSFVGRCLSMPDLPPQKGRDAAEAAELTKRLIESYVHNGFRK